MECIEKRVRSGKRLLTVILILLIIWGIFGPITIINQLLPIPIVMSVMSFTFIILGIVYLRKYRSICSSYKLTKRYVKNLELESFNERNYDLPMSKVKFGKEVFYCETSGAILPYSIVMWAYVHQVSSYGDALIRQVAVRCLDGTNAFLNIKEEEIALFIQMLLEKHPNMSVGYSPKQEYAYKKAVKEFKRNNKK